MAASVGFRYLFEMLVSCSFWILFVALMIGVLNTRNIDILIDYAIDCNMVYYGECNIDYNMMRILLGKTAPLTGPGNAFLRPKAAPTVFLTACATSFFMPLPEPVTMRGIETSSESLIKECPETLPVSEPVVMLVPAPVMMAASKLMPPPASDVMFAEVPKMKAASVLMPCVEPVIKRASARVAMPLTVSFEQFLTALELARRGFLC